MGVTAAAAGAAGATAAPAGTGRQSRRAALRSPAGCCSTERAQSPSSAAGQQRCRRLADLPAGSPWRTGPAAARSAGAQRALRTRRQPQRRPCGRGQRRSRMPGRGPRRTLLNPMSQAAGAAGLQRCSQPAPSPSAARHCCLRTTRRAQPQGRAAPQLQLRRRRRRSCPRRRAAEVNRSHPQPATPVEETRTSKRSSSRVSAALTNSADNAQDLECVEMRQRRTCCRRIGALTDELPHGCSDSACPACWGAVMQRSRPVAEGVPAKIVQVRLPREAYWQAFRRPPSLRRGEEERTREAGSLCEYILHQQSAVFIDRMRRAYGNRTAAN